MSKAAPGQARKGRRGTAFWFTVSGAVMLLIAVLLAGGSLAAARDSRAFDAARECVLPAAWASDCVQQVPGTVSGVINTSGKGAEHKVEVTTANGDYWVSFPGSNEIVESVMDDAQVTITVWRSRIVAVTWDGVDESTSGTPARHLHHMLGGTLLTLGVAMFMLPSMGFASMERRVRRPSKRVTFTSIGTVLAGFPVVAAGFASLAGMSPATDFVTLAAFLVPTLAFATWLAQRSLRGQRQGIETDKRLARSRIAAAGKKPTATTRPSKPVVTVMTPVNPFKGRRTGRQVLRVTMAAVWSYSLMFLAIGAAVAFFAVIAQCVPGRAHDHAPFCPSEVVAGSCRADTSLEVFGTRSNEGEITVYFNGPDSSSPTATFGNDPAIRDAVASASDALPLIPVELWHGRVWQAEFGGRWYLADDRPVYEVGATATFAVVSGILLLMTRIVLGRRAKGSYVGRRQRIQEGAAQALLLAGGIWWLETGAWWGALLVLADAAWVIRSLVITARAASLPRAWKTGTAWTSDSASTTRRGGKGRT